RVDVGTQGRNAKNCRVPVAFWNARNLNGYRILFAFSRASAHPSRSRVAPYVSMGHEMQGDREHESETSATLHSQNGLADGSFSAKSLSSLNREPFRGIACSSRLKFPCATSTATVWVTHSF